MPKRKSDAQDRLPSPQAIARAVGGRKPGEPPPELNADIAAHLDPDGVYTPRAAARVLGLNERTLLNAARAGEFPAYKRWRRWWIPGRLLMDWFIERAIEQTAERRRTRASGDSVDGEGEKP